MAKLINEQTTNEGLREEAADLRMKISRAEAVEKCLEEMKTEMVKLEEHEKVMKETILDLKLELEDKSKSLTKFSNMEEQLLTSQRSASQSLTESRQLQESADRLKVEKMKLEKELEEARSMRNRLTIELEENQKEAEGTKQEVQELKRLGDDQAKQLEVAKSCMAEEQNLVASRLAETSKELGKVVEEKEDLERQMRALTEKVLEKENLESNLKQVEGRLADMEFELGEVEKQRDLVDEQCNSLEQQLEEAKQQRHEEGDVLRQQLREVEQQSLEKENILCQRLQQLEQEFEAAKQTQARAKELEEKLKNSSQAMEEVDLARAKLEELEKVIEDLKYEVEETEKQRDAVDAACDKLEEEKNASKEKLVDQDKFEQEKKVLVQKLLEQKQYSDKMYELNLRLQGGQVLSLGVVEDKAVLVKQLEEVKANRREVLDKLEKVKEELGKKNIAYASLKVDVEKGELEYKKKCEVLQSDLDYEKAVVARLTQDARRLQAI